MVIGAVTYVSAHAVALVTNATHVGRTCKVVYTTIGYVIEACEDASQVSFLPLDIAMFGQPIRSNKPGRYSSWSDITDLIGNLPVIGDS